MKLINVIAFGGLGGNAFSAGLKTILMRLNMPGVDFRTFEQYTSWPRWGATLKSWRDDTVELGHSYGVAAMFGAARRSGKKIPLAISFDPSQWWWSSWWLMGSGGNRAPDNITHVINFYQEGLPIGFQRVYRDDGSERGIQNILIKNVSHAVIEDLPQLQQQAVDAVKLVIEKLNPKK